MQGVPHDVDAVHLGDGFDQLNAVYRRVVLPDFIQPGVVFLVTGLAVLVPHLRLTEELKDFQLGGRSGSCKVIVYFNQAQNWARLASNGTFFIPVFSIIWFADI